MLRHIISNEIFTILLIIGLIVVAIAKLISPKRFDDFILVLGNDKYLKIYSRDQKFFDKFDALLFANLVLSVSVFCFIIYRELIETQNISGNTMFKLSFSIGVFILIKVLIERLIGSLFEIDKLIDQYIFQKTSFKNYVGLLLLPINALLLYSFQPTLPIIYGVIALLILVNILGLISSFKTHQTLIKNNIFYFILYLCALEIAPYIILYKVFIEN
ncbi:DUF4271 domain-containing protein [Algibacter marinivivus]|uniref:DUF4271 domain-containing protein n=1 Tax=Algibacter marinivivus TaxID=2100723 RepID=A0A2U2X737_9FLAO|nr:DUF4271 domain-containing protein [Algibacter marinivivus]PWH83599.1 DUF4271 domain-containing protein [Algibacter marinivivus]